MKSLSLSILLELKITAKESTLPSDKILKNQNTESVVTCYEEMNDVVGPSPSSKVLWHAVQKSHTSSLENSSPKLIHIPKVKQM